MATDALSTLEVALTFDRLDRDALDTDPDIEIFCLD